MIKSSVLCLGFATILATTAVAAGPVTKGGNCFASATKSVKFSDAAKPDTFVVETIGTSCADARVAIYVKSESGWFALHVGDVASFGDSATPAKMMVAIKDIASRIENPRMPKLETWAELEKAGTQPEGNPWRGTPLVKAEYERLVKRKSRTVVIPTDAARGKMVAWDDEILPHPVDLVFYGD